MICVFGSKWVSFAIHYLPLDSKSGDIGDQPAARFALYSQPGQQQLPSRPASFLLSERGSIVVTSTVPSTGLHLARHR